MARKIAIVDLTGCTGCEVNLISLGEQFLDIFQEFEVTNWRMVHDDPSPGFDIVFDEGFVCNEEQEEILREVRSACDVLVAMGTCAISGNVFSQLNKNNYEQCMQRVYGPDYQAMTQFVRPVSDVVPVDHSLPGCPVKLDAVKKLLATYRRSIPRPKHIKPKIPDLVAKIEGHGSLQVDFERKTAKFVPEEGERVVEALVVNKTWQKALQFYARICGICPVSHVLAAIRAVEKALDMKPATSVNLLRRLYSCGQMIQSHLLHLYFMAMPSMTGQGSAIRMSLDFPSEFHSYLNIKRTCEQLFMLIGGSTLHPLTVTAGGFTRIPEKNGLYALQSQIAEVTDEAIDLVRHIASYPFPSAGSPAKRIAIVPRLKDEYPLMGWQIAADGMHDFPADQYRKFIHEEVVDYSPSKIGSLIPGQPVKTGALARIHHFGNRLAPLAAKLTKETSFDPSNPYHNILAQSIEILHFMEEAGELLDRLVTEDLEVAVVEPNSWKSFFGEKSKEDFPVQGIGVIEAPRGILIHEIELDSSGLVKACNIVPPTAINLSGLASETELLMQDNASCQPEQKKSLLTELIRAMDPCITCAVH